MSDDEADQAFLKQHRFRDPNDPTDWESREQMEEFFIVQHRVDCRCWTRKKARDAARYQRLKPKLQHTAHIRNQRRAQELESDPNLQRELKEKHRCAQARYHARNREALAEKERLRHTELKQQNEIKE
ncbi:hypothetical protein VKT23_020621 [Stygiomarasmius scandens]|uniref:Uncharacterized protein n=1 Tax=Marasmiellus scandens TaxID=2682957 RepID=A0ABR1IJW7_9AGAR